MKKLKEYKQGKCEICEQTTKIERLANTGNAWCCEPCIKRMKAKAIQAGRESRLFG